MVKTSQSRFSQKNEMHIIPIGQCCDSGGVRRNCGQESLIFDWMFSRLPFVNKVLDALLTTKGCAVKIEKLIDEFCMPDVSRPFGVFNMRNGEYGPVAEGDEYPNNVRGHVNMQHKVIWPHRNAGINTEKDRQMWRRRFARTYAILCDPNSTKVLLFLPKSFMISDSFYSGDDSPIEPHLQLLLQILRKHECQNFFVAVGTTPDLLGNVFVGDERIVDRSLIYIPSQFNVWQATKEVLETLIEERRKSDPA